jgi:hypothetical protein
MIRRARSSDGREMVFALNWTPREAGLRLAAPLAILAPQENAGDLFDTGDIVTVPGMAGCLLVGKG